MSLYTYETVVIFSPDEAKAKKDIKKYTKIMQDCYPHTKIKVEDMGERKLAYEIKENRTGYYVVFTWKGTPENVADLERQFRINDNVLKFITIKADDDDDLDEYAEVPDDMIGEIAKSPAEILAEEAAESEQPIDAMDVLLGLATYKKKEV